MADHGINVSRADTAVATPNAATCGIPFVIGTAPLSKATGTAATVGTPVLCTSYTEAEEQLGYDDDWAKYTVCEVMHYHFKLCACQPVIFLPLAEDAEAAAVAAAVEQVEACLTMFGIVPDLIMAPGFSKDATVSAAIDAKAGSINGMFTGKALVDISAKTYTAAVQAKNSGTFTEKTILCWPNGTLGNLKFHVLTPLDHYIKRTMHVPYYARFMDDMLLLVDGKKAAWEAVEEIDGYLRENLGLQLNNKTAVIPLGHAVEFVGRKISPEKIELRRQTSLGMKKHLRYVREAYARGEVPLEYALSVIQSYLGLMKGCNNDALRNQILEDYVLVRHSQDMLDAAE